MRIKLKIGRAGYGYSWKAGQIVEVSDAEARRLVAAGKARFVGEPPEPEKPQTPEIETAALEPPKRSVIGTKRTGRVTRKKAAY